jgi:hypothetical protein
MLLFESPKFPKLTFVRLVVRRLLHSSTSRNMKHAFAHLFEAFSTSNALVENFVVPGMRRLGVVQEMRTFVGIVTKNSKL